MFEKKPTTDELAALKRVKGGFVIDPAMFERLRKAGLVEQLLGGKAVTDKGRRALGLIR
jgi:ribosomal protein S19E (S16A)